MPGPSGGGGMMTPPVDPMADNGMGVPVEQGGSTTGLDEGAGVVQTMNSRLKAIAQSKPEMLQQVQAMLTPELVLVIGVLFGEEPAKVLAPMMDKSKTTRVIPKSALERIGLDKFESMIAKAGERANGGGMMAPSTPETSGNSQAQPKATQV